MKKFNWILRGLEITRKAALSKELGVLGSLLGKDRILREGIQTRNRGLEMSTRNWLATARRVDGVELARRGRFVHFTIHANEDAEAEAGELAPKIKGARKNYVRAYSKERAIRLLRETRYKAFMKEEYEKEDLESQEMAESIRMGKLKMGKTSKTDPGTARFSL